jgi:hypothetical protein
MHSFFNHKPLYDRSSLAKKIAHLFFGDLRLDLSHAQGWVAIHNDPNAVSQKDPDFALVANEPYQCSLWGPSHAFKAADVTSVHIHGHLRLKQGFDKLTTAIRYTVPLDAEGRRAAKNSSRTKKKRKAVTEGEKDDPSSSTSSAGSCSSSLPSTSYASSFVSDILKEAQDTISDLEEETNAKRRRQKMDDPNERLIQLHSSLDLASNVYGTHPQLLPQDSPPLSQSMAQWEMQSQLLKMQIQLNDPTQVDVLKLTSHVMQFNHLRQAYPDVDLGQSALTVAKRIKEWIDGVHTSGNFPQHHKSVVTVSSTT